MPGNRLKGRVCRKLQQCSGEEREWRSKPSPNTLSKLNSQTTGLWKNVTLQIMYEEFKKYIHLYFLFIMQILTQFIYVLYQKNGMLKMSQHVSVNFWYQNTLITTAISKSTSIIFSQQYKHLSAFRECFDLYMFMSLFME